MKLKSPFTRWGPGYGLPRSTALLSTAPQGAGEALSLNWLRKT